MTLPAPNLDDRRFQELVNDAKRMVQQRCPDWTDHNVSDPGVTLIEVFAWMTDQLVYRLNRVPDRNYVKFLELLGVRLYPGSAARTGMTFWLAGEVEQAVTVPTTTEVSTRSAEDADVVVFRTTEDLVMPPCELVALQVEHGADDRFDESEILQGGAPFDAFQDVPEPGDALLLGLSDALPRCAVRFDLDCRVEGVGVDPDDPPLLWEAWTGDDWSPCDLEVDGTGGLNARGAVVVHLPRDHATSVIDQRHAGWVRCRVLEPLQDQPFYTASPEIVSASATTVGGTADASHARIVRNEVLGTSEGVPGQRFRVAHAPVLADQGGLAVQVATEDGWESWREVDTFAEHDGRDAVFVLDAVTGEVEFGPAVRLPDGSVRQYGRVPPKGASVRLPSYQTGGGSRGNVAARTVVQLLSAIPFVDRVVNRFPARGGVDPESMDNARVRGPTRLWTRNRAVTTVDYEQLARAAAPEVARVRCVPVDDGGEAGVARVLVVPAVSTTGGQMPFEDLVPHDDTLARIAEYLDERRTLGARVVVEPPFYQGVTIVARLRARRTANAQEVHELAVAALHAYFHPTTGGPDGDGWPFGRPILVGEAHAVLQSVRGIAYVEQARMFAADPLSGERGEPADRIDLDPNALPFSYEHRVRVEDLD